MNNQYFNAKGKYDPRLSEKIRLQRQGNNTTPSQARNTISKDWTTIQRDYQNFRESGLSVNEYLIVSR